MKKRTLDNARAIVKEIIEDIEQRSNAARLDPVALNDLQVRLRQVEDDVSLECLRGIPPKYIALIREKLGDEVADALEPGRLGAMFKNRDRIRRIHLKIAALLETYQHALTTARESLTEAERLRFVQREMAESQIANLQELEIFEQRMLQSQWLVDIQLEPFETAMSRMINFLDARHIEVYLFDDDKFLTTNLNTDGKIFVYNKQQEEGRELPHSVETPTFQEVQETIYETPLVIEARQIGHCRILCTKPEHFDPDGWIKKVDFIIPVLARLIEANQNRLLAAKVYTDDLTQLYNKRKLNEQMGRLFQQFKTGQKKLFVAMVDIDKFKTLNDTYGHPVGDKVLKKVAGLIRDGVPYAYRYGGEEFCAVFYGYEKQAVLEAMEILRRNIEKTSFADEGIEQSLTVSSGIAEFEVSMNAVMDAIDRADKALYVSKEDGRNRCTYYDDIKDRYLADANRLRQRNVLLEEELAQLRKELSGLKAKKAR
ncbi:MAG: GGDEF domain-containing protein [Deltaproteobacteria bacterium]